MTFNYFADHYKIYVKTHHIKSNEPCESKSYISNGKSIRQFAILRDKNGIDLARVKKNKIVILFN